MRINFVWSVLGLFISINLLIGSYCNANLGIVSVQPNFQVGDYPVGTTRTNDAHEIQSNIRNLFDSVAKNDEETGGVYRKVLRQEIAREQHAFDAMMDGLRRARNTNKKLSKKSRSSVLMFKRSALEEIDPNNPYGLISSFANESKVIIKHNWEITYTRIKNAKNDTETRGATIDFRNTGPNDARFMEPNNMYSDLALFYCALKTTRMGMDDAYTMDVHPGAASGQPWCDADTVAKHWRDYLVEHKTEGLAAKIRKAYEYMKPFEDSYAEEFAKNTVRITELCRRYEDKIRDMQATYESHLRKGERIALWHVLKNATDWSFFFDDVYVVNRIREAQNRSKIAWLWLEQDDKTVMPLCTTH